MLRRDQHHFRAVRLLQALGQFGGDQGRREILVLHIDAALGRADGGDVQRLCLAHLRNVLPRAHGPRQADIDLGKGRRDLAGPARPPNRRRSRQRLAGRPQPAIPEQLARGRRRVTVDQRHRLMATVEATVVMAGFYPARIVVQMLGRVPPVRSDVAAADEGQGVVDDDRLLVMAGAERQFAVEYELDVRAREGLAVHQREEVLGGRDGHRRLPAKHSHVEIGVLGQLGQERPDAVAFRALAVRSGVENRARLEGPVQQVHAVLGAAHRVHGRVEIGRHIDQQGGAIGARLAPAGLLGNEQGRGCRLPRSGAFRRRAILGH